MVDILITLISVVLLEVLASYKLMKAWAVSSSLEPHTLAWLYRLGLLGDTRIAQDPHDLLRSEWRTALELAASEDRIPRWKFQLLTCKICLFTHLPLLAGCPVALVAWWTLPDPWDWQKSLAGWLLGWLCCPQFQFDSKPAHA